MLFNSLEFALFLPIVFCLYWIIPSRHTRLQNILLIIVSYIFYGWWDWRFLSLIFFSSLIDFLVARQMAQTEAKRTRNVLLGISLGVNLGMLLFFKYFNFFVDSWVDMWAMVGIEMSRTTLEIILPVGISFYTFQTLSYTIDVYKRQLEATRDPIAFFAYVSFFPQLVAGPIERATQLLPQFYRPRKFDFEVARDGISQILWGLFKKVVVADNCAMIVNEVFADPAAMSSPMLLLGAVYFAFQIYGDFSGYSDIAIGTAKLFGFSLMTNFRYPYFARDIAEFWRRWHISLSTWFRDYLYIPLGGSRGGTRMKVRNTFIIFLVSGFWHGANWTFVVWGGLNALYYLPLLLSKQNRRYLGKVAEGKYLPSFKELGQIGTTFFLTCIAWIFFRAENIGQAFTYLYEMFNYEHGSLGDATRYLPMVIVMLAIEWLQREKAHPMQLENRPILLYWSLNIALVISMMLFANTSEEMSFIYFQF